MKKQVVTIEQRWSPQGFDALVVKTEDGVFWLHGVFTGLSRAYHRVGEKITVKYAPEDQFAYEV